MRKINHLVSIILPVRNCQEYLPFSLESILRQNYKNIEVIAIDDKSSDRSYSILKTWKKKYKKKLRLLRNKKQYGLAVSLNRAIKMARGSFIAFADAHDIVTKGRIKAQLTYLLKNQKTAAVGAQCFLSDEKNKLIGKSSFPLDNLTIVKTFLSGISMQFETIMVAKEKLPKDILHFTNKTYPIIFTEVLLKISSYGQLANLPNFLQRRRIIENKSDQLKVLAQRAVLWVRSAFEYGTRPSISSLFTTLARTK